MLRNVTEDRLFVKACWIHLAQVMDQWRALVKAGSTSKGNFLTS
jgi:hypothetical protein